jgi:antitoxin CptB
MAPDEGRLRWRCRRGMKELDILLSRYMDERFYAAPPQEQEAFRRLLESPDPEIYAYCFGQERPPELLAVLIERIAANPSSQR